MLTEKMQNALIHQISEEAYASHYYLAMASWCDTAGWQGSAKYMYAQSESERVHLMKLFRYVNDAGGHAVITSIKTPPHVYKTLLEIFTLTLEHERHVTQQINVLVETCLQEKDYSTFSFLQWYVSEQHEEERQLKYILDLIGITGEEGRSLYLVDRQIGSMVPENGKKP